MEPGSLDQSILSEQILDQLPMAVFVKDRDGRFLRCNRRFADFARIPREQILGRTIADFASPAWTAATLLEDQQAWDSGLLVTSERRIGTFDPPIDVLVSRKIIDNGGQSYLLGYFVDISEQRAAREAMQRAVESAQAASRAKSEFLANMSHEIRTPMNGILGMAELVLETSLTDEQRADLLLVKASADALLNIVGDVLDFSKIEAGKLDIEEVPFDLHQLVDGTVRAMALRARQKGLALDCALSPGLPRVVTGDPGRLRQVLVNLIGNAIKFTPAGQVTVALWVAAHHDAHSDIMFAVSDTGIGVPLDKQRMIFEAFAQVDGSTTRQYGGTGLGLTICRRLVMLMQGRLDVHSAPGRGSTFSFVVPLRVEAPGMMPGLSPGTLCGTDCDATPDALPDGVVGATSGALDGAASDVMSGAASDAASDSVSDAASVAAQPAGGRLRVLLAEDNPVNQRLALRLLEKLGHRVALADSGLAVLELTARQAFDLILMDVQMPGLDGLSATRQIRLRELIQGGHVTIVAMTARAMAGDRERCLEAGMDDYLAKPVDGRQLRAMLARHHHPAWPAADTASPAGMAPVLDWLGALRRLDGDNELLLELAALFLDDGPQLWRELAASLDAFDPARSARALHSLKGVLLNFGAARAVAAAELLAAALAAALAPASTPAGTGQPAASALAAAPVDGPAPAAPWQPAMVRLGAAVDEVYDALRALVAGDDRLS